jgi:hypothetical protein
MPTKSLALTKLTPLLVVDEIEPCLAQWQALGHTLTVRVPETGPSNFVILNGPSGEVMMQTKASLAEDLPGLGDRKPTYLLYADVKSLAAARAALPSAKVIVEERTTPYGAKESWLELENGTILGLAEH